MESTRTRRVIELALALSVFIYLIIGIFSLGPTLINDEYAPLDYMYRVVQAGHFFPTPDRVHKPFSLVLGLSSVLENPLVFELIIVLFAALFAQYLLRFVSASLGLGVAVISFILIFSNPDILNYTATGGTFIPFAALAFIAGLSATRLEEKPSGIWVYAVCFFIGGLARPECWLFAAPLALYFWPIREKVGWWRFIVAVGIIELAPIIWFGKDLLINHDFFHGLKVATAIKVYSAGAPFTLFGSFEFFWIRISAKISSPTILFGLFGAALFIRERGLRGIIHPLILFPILVIPYITVIVYMGVYSVQRYYFFTSLFLLIFAAYAGVRLFRLFRETPSKTRWLALVALVAFAVAHLVYLPIKYKKDLDVLRLEAKVQREMIQVGDYLKERIPEGDRPLILLPGRRDEQLSWLFRDREIPNTVILRLAFFLEDYKRYDFLNLEPDWIIHLWGDYHAFSWGPQQKFKWLKFQDHTTLRDVNIDLAFETSEIRVFKVTYPPDWPEPPPMPQIP